MINTPQNRVSRSPTRATAQMGQPDGILRQVLTLGLEQEQAAGGYRAGGSFGRLLSTRTAARTMVAWTRLSSPTAIAVTRDLTRSSQVSAATAAASTSACSISTASS